MAESAFGRANMVQAPKVSPILSQQMRKWRNQMLRAIAIRIPIFLPSGSRRGLADI